MVDRQPDLVLSERAIEDIGIRVCGRRLARREILRAFADLRWLVCLNDGRFAMWSPNVGPMAQLALARPDLPLELGKLRETLLIEIETQFRITAS